MVRRCNNAGVRIYVDVVFNHMTGNHKVAVGTSGSTANTFNFSYQAVPYTRVDFHTPCEINNYQNATNVRDCQLSGLHDLDQSKEFIREKIVDFMNDAIEAGVAGFRYAEFSCNLCDFIAIFFKYFSRYSMKFS